MNFDTASKSKNSPRSITDCEASAKLLENMAWKYSTLSERTFLWTFNLWSEFPTYKHKKHINNKYAHY